MQLTCSLFSHWQEESGQPCKPPTPITQQWSGVDQAEHWWSLCQAFAFRKCFLQTIVSFICSEQMHSWEPLCSGVMAFTPAADWQMTSMCAFSAESTHLQIMHAVCSKDPALTKWPCSMLSMHEPGSFLGPLLLDSGETGSLLWAE